MKHNNFLGLPESSVNALSWAVFFFVACLGVRVVRASDIAFKVANTQLVTSNSADKLERLAQQLEEQAEIIEQKEEAYQALTNVYQRSLKNRKGYETLKGKIEAIEALPEVENIEQIQNEIIETELELSELEVVE